ncbi:efflux RND transporter periplasmic adaptor subunit [Microbulbifer elongatus]|uniref:Efflux RND transporter periplasmic adaptor subunit n=1 Tax=Microbulbifer elongatus TaxID=86173 RepID=A0ABT1P2B7_9GAMM|nr:efflux RND transporter periplasmic adaptor subunit [Microbulbifer elongatus]
MTNIKQRLWIVIAVALMLGATTFWWWSGRPVSIYKTEALAIGDIESVVAAIGTAEPYNSVDVGVQVSGQITRIHVQPGDTVKQGQLLAEIDARVLTAVVEAGRAELAMLKAQLQERLAEVTLAEQKQQRQIKLFGTEATSQEQLQTAEANLAIARARVKQLQASIQQTQSQLRADEARLSYSRIYAPMAGTVLTIAVKQGQTLNAAYQTPTLLQIADLATMRIRAYVSEADIHRIRFGMPVRFNTLGNSGRVWESQVEQILPMPPKADTDGSQLQAVTYAVLFNVDNSDGALLPGMTAEADFVVTAAPEVLVAPLAALMPESAESGTYLAKILLPDGQTEQRKVTVGRRDRLHAEVINGLEAGELLIVGSQQYQRRRDSW